MGFFSKLFGIVAVTSASVYIEKVFDERIEKSIWRSVFLFSLFLIALIIGRLSFLNESLRLFICSSIILSLFIYSVIKFVTICYYVFFYIYDKFEVLIKFDAPLKNIILDFLIYKYEVYFKAYDFFTKFLNCKWELFLPSSNKVYDHLHSFLWDKIKIKLTYYVCTTIFILVLLKPGASHYLSDVKIYYLYFTPFSLSIDYFFGTNFTGCFI